MKFTNQEYTEVATKINDLEENLLKTLVGVQKEEYIMSKISDSSNTEMLTAFTEGFKLATKIMAEVYYTEDEND